MVDVCDIGTKPRCVSEFYHFFWHCIKVEILAFVHKIQVQLKVSEEMAGIREGPNVVILLPFEFVLER